MTRPRAAFSPERTVVFLASVCALSWLGAPAVRAELPTARLHGIFPLGAKQGTSVEVKVEGDDLDEASSMIFSHPGIRGLSKTTPAGPFDEGPRAVDGRFVVTVAPDVPPGVYEARVAGRFGVSNPRAFVVGGLDEAVEKESNNDLESAGDVSLETTINGRAEGGADIDWFRFPVEKGQRVIADCRARSIDSLLEPVLVLYDPSGREIERRRRSAGSEPLIDFTAEEDGAHAIQVYDFLYRGGREYGYRLTLTAGPHIAFVFPPAVAPGTESTVSVYGRNLPGSAAAPDAVVHGRPLERLEVKVEAPAAARAVGLPVRDFLDSRGAVVDGFEHRLELPNGLSSPVFIGLATAPVSVESEPNDAPEQANEIDVPCEFAGRFSPRDDQDWLRFAARKGQAYRLEVFSHRLGLPTDPYLLIQQVTGEGEKTSVKEIRRIDDGAKNIGDTIFNTATDDPVFRFQAPEDATYRILVRDLYGGSQGDPRHVYRLSIRAEEPDFRLYAVPRSPQLDADPRKEAPKAWGLFLRRGGTVRLDVLAERRDGFSGPIRLEVEGLPEEVASSGGLVPAGLDTATLVLVAAEDAPPWQGTIRIVGKASISGKEVARACRYGTVVWSEQRSPGIADSRRAQDLVLAVSGVEKAPFLVELGERKVWEMSRGGKLEVPVKLVRRAEIKGKLTLIAENLPPNVSAKKLTLDGNADGGELELEVKKDAPLGEFPFHLRVVGQVVYRRNPEAAAAAEERRKKLEEIAGEAKARAEQTAEARKTAEAAALEAAAALEKAEESVASAEKTVLEVATADSGSGAAEKAKTTIATLVSAVEARVDARARAAEAEAAKAAAVKVAEEVEGRAKAAAEALEEAKKREKASAEAAKPKDVKVGDLSTAAVLRVTPAPVRFGEGSGETTVEPGAKVEVPVSIERLYGFEGPVELRLELPGGAKGLEAAKATAGEKEGEAKLTIEAAPDASAGRFDATLKAKVKFNGSDLEIERKVVIVVAKKEA